MTITWPTSATTICHGATRTVGQAAGPASLDIDVAPGLRRRAYLEAPGVAYEHAGNDECVVAFRVRVACANASAAAALAVSVAADTARVGALGIGGLTLADAGLRRCRPVVQGLAVLIDYQFAGYATPTPV
jgi:hypothetical protein